MSRKKLSKLATRIQSALNYDPVWELAKELVIEGYDDSSIRPYLEEFLIEDPKRIKFLNYLRDVKLGVYR
jgi:hypothetical protein